MKIKTPDKEVLNKAKMAGFNRIAKTDSAKRWVEYLFEQTLIHEAEYHTRLRARQRGALDRFKVAIGAFAADLLRHYAHEEAEGFMYRPLNRQELSFTFVTSESFEKLIQYWAQIGWLEMTGHINAVEDWEGAEIKGYSRARRYRATTKFVEVSQTFQITPDTVTEHFTISSKHTDLVQCRETSKAAHGRRKGGKQVRLKGPKIDYQRELIRRLNDAMQTHTYSLKELPTVRRLFNCADRDSFDFDLGGRLYCISSDDWMDMPKEERRNITIDGEATAEIDVSSSHLFILYAINGECLDYSSDPYSVPPYPRDVIKQVIVTMIGAGKQPQRWPKGFNKTYKEKHGRLPNDDYKLKDVVEAVLKKHPILKKLRAGRLDWANLQFEESECFLSAMLHLHESKGIPSLPIHDSLIVRHSDLYIAEEYLKLAYEDRFGCVPKISIPDV